MSCGVDRRRGSDPKWLWCRLAAVAPLRPLAWELPCAAGAALKKQNQTNKNSSRSSLVVQLVKGLVLSLLWHGFYPWPRNFHMLQMCPLPTPKTKNKTKQKKPRKPLNSSGLTFNSGFKKIIVYLPIYLLIFNHQLHVFSKDNCNKI